MIAASDEGQPLAQGFSCLGSKAWLGEAQLCGLDSVLMRKLLKYQEVHKLKLCEMRKVKEQREHFVKRVTVAAQGYKRKKSIP